MKTFRLLALVALSGALFGCGTTSAIRPASEHATEEPAVPRVQQFSSVTVLDFENKTGGPEADGAGRLFADLIADAVRAEGSFDTVERKPTGTQTLLISGDITRYDAGDASARLWIGFGAGQTNFDATVRFSDTVQGNEIGVVEVDRNSWALGGVFAAGQDLDYLMGRAATKIADELAQAKRSPVE